MRKCLQLLTPIKNKNFMSLKQYLAVFFLISFCATAIAQEKLTPLSIQQHYSKVEKPSLKRSSKKPVELPFIDDFSTTDVYPDANLWEDQYVFINRDMAVNPPTIGIATFDGLNEEGQPYAGFSVDNAPCDTLTSVEINLGNNTPADSVVFNFFYQAGGYADFPNPNDTLILEFKHEAGWDTIWKAIKKDEILNDFEYVSINISDSAEKYLKPDFQFRFRNYARPAGHNDFWHIDYVEVTKNRRFRCIEDTMSCPLVAYPSKNDQAFVDLPTSIIEPYSTMTFEQFLFQQDISKNKANNFTHSFKVSNLDDIRSRSNYVYKINLPAINSTLFESSDTELLIEVDGISCDTRDIVLKPFTISDDDPSKHIIPFDAIEDTVEIEMEYFIQTSNVRKDNDTIRRNYFFSNQLAYDDGIADFAYAVDGESAEFAQRYVVYGRDEISGLMIHFARIETGQSDRLFSIKIFDQIEGIDDSDTTVLIYPEKNPLDPYAEPELLSVEYPTNRNHSGYRLYCFDQKVLVSDTFYVGIQQLGSVGILVGFDKNNQAGNKNLFYNLANEWTPSELEGSVMLRPVFDMDASDCRKTKIAVKDPLSSVTSFISGDFDIYPNPASNFLNIDFNEKYKVDNIRILDATGRMVQNYNGYTNKVDIGKLTNGIYFIQLNAAGKTGIKKFMKSN